MPHTSYATNQCRTRGGHIQYISSWSSGCNRHRAQQPSRQVRPAPTARQCHVIVHAKKPESPQDMDMVERMVSFFFPKALSDPAPMGLKRINFEELPDQYCELTRRAAPVPGDEADPLVAAVRPLLAATQLEERPLRCVYDADRDGWSAAAFHGKVDGMGAAVVVAASAGGALLGGYNSEGWIGLGEDRASRGAFLFTWPQGGAGAAAAAGTELGGPVYKLEKVGGPNLAVIDRPDSGPQFGADGLSVPLKGLRGQERMAKSKLGSYYARLPDGSRSLFAAGEDPKKTQLAWLKVYAAAVRGVEWRLEGITWKSEVVE